MIDSSVKPEVGQGGVVAVAVAGSHTPFQPIKIKSNFIEPTITDNKKSSNESGVVILAVVFISLFVCLVGYVVGSKAPGLLDQKADAGERASFFKRDVLNIPVAN